MRSLLLLIFFASALLCGFWMGKEPVPAPSGKSLSAEKKPFVFVVYGCNCAPWCERTLRSIFEQEYDSYRLVWIDDASTDATLQLAQDFILANNQEGRAIIMSNETRLGRMACFERGMGSVADKEIALFLDGSDWLASNEALNRLNTSFQNPSIQLVMARALSYPLYQMEAEGLLACYGSLARKVDLSHPQEWQKSARKAAKRRWAALNDILQFKNNTHKL